MKIAFGDEKWKKVIYEDLWRRRGKKNWCHGSKVDDHDDRWGRMSRINCGSSGGLKAFIWIVNRMLICHFSSYHKITIHHPRKFDYTAISSTATSPRMCPLCNIHQSCDTETIANLVVMPNHDYSSRAACNMQRDGDHPIHRRTITQTNRIYIDLFCSVVRAHQWVHYYIWTAPRLSRWTLVSMGLIALHCTTEWVVIFSRW